MPRPRLVERMRGRFHRPLTLVVAGAGLGKSTLLAQSMSDAARVETGIDVWLRCEPDDATDASLAAGVGMALGVDLEVEDPTPERSAEAVMARSPDDIALLLDDAHVIPPDSSGARFLQAFFDALPANGHLVIASREEPPLRTSRLEAQGAVERVDEGDLLMTPEELETLADLRDVSPHVVREVAGWPALAELVCATGRPGAINFLREEILESFTSEDRRRFAILGALGEGDALLATAALGEDVEIGRLLTDVPLVALEADGTWAVHALWREALVDEIDPVVLSESLVRAARERLLRDDVGGAFRLAVRAGDQETMLSVLRTSSASMFPGVQVDRLRAWLDDVPADLRGRAEVRTLEGMILGEEAPDRAEVILVEAVEAFRRAGDATGELGALEQLGLVAFGRRDPTVLLTVQARLSELAADGVKGADALAAIGRAAGAVLMDDGAGALAELDAISFDDLPGPWEGVAEYLRATASLARGDLETAVTAAERAATIGPPRLRLAARGEVRTASFYLGANEAPLRNSEAILGEHVGVGATHNVALAAPLTAMVATLTSDLEGAKDHLLRAERTVAEVGGPLAVARLALARSLYAAARGDEAEATRLIESAFSDPSPATIVAHRRQLAPSYILLPAARALWDAADLEGHWALARDLASRVVDFREGRSSERSLRSLRWPDARILRAHLALPWAIELCVAGALHDVAPAHQLLRELGPLAPEIIEGIAGRRESRAAQRVRALLRTIPTRPSHHLRASLLGDVELSRDGTIVHHEDWSRRRVRELFAFLVDRRSVARPEAAGALWPDVDPRRAGENLRTNLMYLLRVLEPQRRRGAPSYVIRTDRERLTVVGSDVFGVDLWDLEGALDRAAEQEAAGSAAHALATYIDALPLWRGEPFGDLDLGWTTLRREQLRVRYVNASLRAAELLVSSRRPSEAIEIAERALLTDGWSERAYRARASAELALGDRAAAFATLKRCESMLEELGVAAEPRTREMMAGARSGLA